MTTSRRLRTLAATLAAFSLCGPSDAADWSASGSFSQSFQTGGGLDSENESFDPVSTTSVGLTFIGRTPLTTWTFSPGLSGFLSSDSDNDLTSLRPRFNGSVSHRGRRSQLTGSLSFVPRLVDFTPGLDDFGLDEEPDPGADSPPEPDLGEDSDGGRRVRDDVLQLNTNARIGWRYSVDSLNSLTLGAFVRRRDFTEDDDELERSTTVGANVGWSRALSPITSANIALRGQRFLSDDSSDEDTSSVSLRGGLNTRLDPVTSLGFSLGGALTEDDEGGWEPSVVGSVSFRRQPRSTTNFSAALTQSVDQDISGDISNVTALTFGVSEQLTRRSSISVNARAGFENPLFATDVEDRRTFTIGPSYTYSIDRNWRLRAGYTFRIEEGDDDDYSSRFSIGLSRGFNIF